MIALPSATVPFRASLGGLSTSPWSAPPIAADGAEHERGAGRGWQSEDRHSSRDSPTGLIRLHGRIVRSDSLPSPSQVGLLIIASVWGTNWPKNHFPSRHFFTKQIMLGGKEEVVGVDERGRDGLGDGRWRTDQGDAAT